jgi:hypothetical protein
VLVCTAVAEAADDHGHFFLFVAPGTGTSDTGVVPRIQAPANATLVHAGGGGEGVLKNVWGVGTDFGGFARTHGTGTVTTVSVNGFYHPLGQHRRRVDPYFALGYGWFFRDEARQTLGIPNLGGGLNYWLPGRRRHDLGLKLEFRSYARAGQESVKYREVRMGVSLWQ